MHFKKSFPWCINHILTQDVNKSGKNFQMRKIRFFSLLAHKNLIQSIIVLIWQIGEKFHVRPFEDPYVPECHRSWHPELNFIINNLTIISYSTSWLEVLSKVEISLPHSVIYRCSIPQILQTQTCQIELNCGNHFLSIFAQEILSAKIKKMSPTDCNGNRWKLISIILYILAHLLRNSTK